MKQVIGRKDKADFPQFGFVNLRVKIDTGAYGSTIHCHYIKEVEEAGKIRLHCRLLDPSHPQYQNETSVFEDFSKKEIRNSFGKSEKRYVIQTIICLFGEEIETKFSLSERSEMKSPVLLGRKLLNGKFVVDTAKYNLSFRAKKHKKNDKKS
ncbi:MAG: ATP-dependent zinc protease [Bacteroidia bacterium]